MRGICVYFLINFGLGFLFAIFLVFDQFWFKKIGTILSDWSKTNRQKRSAWLYIF